MDRFQRIIRRDGSPRFRACTRSPKFTLRSIDRWFIHLPCVYTPFFLSTCSIQRLYAPLFSDLRYPRKRKEKKGASLFFVRSLVYHFRSTKLASQFCILRFSLLLVPEFLKRFSSIVKASWNVFKKGFLPRGRGWTNHVSFLLPRLDFAGIILGIRGRADSSRVSNEGQIGEKRRRQLCQNVGYREL